MKWLLQGLGVSDELAGGILHPNLLPPQPVACLPHLLLTCSKREANEKRMGVVNYPTFNITAEEHDNGAEEEIEWPLWS